MNATKLEMEQAMDFIKDFSGIKRMFHLLALPGLSCKAHIFIHRESIQDPMLLDPHLIMVEKLVRLKSMKKICKGLLQPNILDLEDLRLILNLHTNLIDSKEYFLGKCTNKNQIIIMYFFIKIKEKE